MIPTYFRKYKKIRCSSHREVRDVLRKRVLAPVRRSTTGDVRPDARVREHRVQTHRVVPRGASQERLEPRRVRRVHDRGARRVRPNPRRAPRRERRLHVLRRRRRRRSRRERERVRARARARRRRARRSAAVVSGRLGRGPPPPPPLIGAPGAGPRLARSTAWNADPRPNSRWYSSWNLASCESAVTTVTKQIPPGRVSARVARRNDAKDRSTPSRPTARPIGTVASAWCAQTTSYCFVGGRRAAVAEERRSSPPVVGSFFDFC